MIKKNLSEFEIGVMKGMSDMKASHSKIAQDVGCSIRTSIRHKKNGFRLPQRIGNCGPKFSSKPFWRKWKKFILEDRNRTVMDIY